MAEAYPSVACGLAAWSEQEERVALTRLAAKWNNGSEHFDHGPEGFSWLCLACGIEAGQAAGRAALQRLVRYSEELDKAFPK